MENRKLTAAAEILYASVRENGLLETLQAVFGKNFSVAVPMTEAVCEAGIHVLELSARSEHCLFRADAATLADVADLILGNRLDTVRNLGKKSRNEIKSRMLLYAYEKLPLPDRLAFLQDTVERNADAARPALLRPDYIA